MTLPRTAGCFNQSLHPCEAPAVRPPPLFARQASIFLPSRIAASRRHSSMAEACKAEPPLHPCGRALFLLLSRQPLFHRRATTLSTSMALVNFFVDLLIKFPKTMSPAQNEKYNPEVVDEDDDNPVLSKHALQALKEFLTNQSSVSVAGEGSEDVMLVPEDWRLSQFWYDRGTAETIADEIRYLCSSTPAPVACVACPTIYAYLKKIDRDFPVHLLEYDRRFEHYGSDYIFYDYNLPEELPPESRQAYKIIVADPPYLSEECLEKVAHTISYLTQREKHYLLLLTGEVQKEKAAELLNTYPCGFMPQHSHKLGNEFRLFTNYDPGERLGGWIGST